MGGALNELLASLQVQTMNLHSAHWNVEGCHSYITMHKYLDELYSANLGHVDKIAEFLRIHGGDYPIGTMTDCLDKSHLSELEFYESNEIEPILDKAIKDNNIIISQAKAIFKNYEEFPDVNDYMATMIDDYGKRNWFLKASKSNMDV